VPVAVSALSSADIKRYDATNLTAIANLAPDVILTKANAGSGASFTIRGIGSPPLDNGVEQTVTIASDGIQISRGRIIEASLFDLAQTEILKGPQALFFGKNSPAGVISLTSNLPTREYSGYAQLGYEFKNRQRYFETAISGPIVPTLYARLAVRGEQDQGYIDNIARPMANPWAPSFPLPGAWDSSGPRQSDIAGRLTLQYEPTENLNIVARATVASDDSDEAGSSALQTVCGHGVTQVLGSGILDPTGDCALDRRRSATALPAGLAVNWKGSNGGIPYNTYKGALGSVNATYRWKHYAITSTSGYNSLHSVGFANYTYTSTGQIFSDSGEIGNTFSQELRLVSDFESPLNFTFGGYYDRFNRIYISRPLFFFAGPDPLTGRYYTYDSIANTTGHSYSAFGQVRWNFLPDFELAAGARWTQEDKRLDTANQWVHSVVALVAPGLLLPEGVPVQGDFGDHNVSPEATLTWHPNPSATLYGAYKTGYKSGGFSVGGILSGATTIDSLRLGSEKAKGGEIGYKTELLNRSLRLELTAFSYNYDNLQVTAFDAKTVSYITKNAARARTRGIETSVTWRALNQLTLRGNADYDEARYVSFPGAQCYTLQTPEQGCINGAQDLADQPLLRAPQWTFNFGGTYEIPLWNGSSLALNADAYYSSRYETQVNEDPATTQAGFWRLNAGITLSTLDDHLQVSLIGKNLTDTLYIAYSNDNPGSLPGTYQQMPELTRQITLQATARF
jgi:outer membrane receptor protein involved in Fe transport